MTGPAQSFLGIEGELATLRGARVVLLPVPHDATTSFHAGARRAPEAICEASRHIEEYDEELEREIWRCGIHVAEQVLVPSGDASALVEAVRTRVSELLASSKMVITLGGDHTVAVGAARAHAERHPGLSVLQIDAHGDLRDSYQGSPYSHACVARRLLEVADLVQVGTRSVSAEGAGLLRRMGREPFWARRIASCGDGSWMEEVVSRLGPSVYVTFDVDGLDPSIMPATGTPEPGGLGWWQTLNLLRLVARRRRVVGADLCELLPTEGLHSCDVLAARLVYKMIGYFLDP